MVCGFGEVGKGCAQSLRGQGCRVVVTEIDPICALQAAMEGYQVATLDEMLETADIFITSTGNRDIISAVQMGRMKDKAIVGNIGPLSTTRSTWPASSASPASSTSRSSRSTTSGASPDGHSVLVLAEGRLLNLGLRTGHPSFVMSASFTNQVLAQLALHRNRGEYEKQVYMLPKQLDEKVARLHPRRPRRQADRAQPRSRRTTSACRWRGPYKPDHYRY